MILLTCQDVSLSYGQKKVLERVNFSLEEGICMAIIGENGCGKSTLMKGILGLKGYPAAVSSSVRRFEGEILAIFLNIRKSRRISLPV